MKLTHIVSMISSTNGYISLKYPLVIFAVLSTIVPLILFISYTSTSWFSYELFVLENRTNTIDRFTFEYGTLGLWSICVQHPEQSDEKCEQWIRQTRPENFLTILIITSFALCLSNLAIFPSWITVVLLFYNQANRYLHYIIGLCWGLFFLSLTVASLLCSALVVTSTTKLYSPGIFSLNGQYMGFHAGYGFHALGYAFAVSIVCLLTIIVTLIWRKTIEVELMEEEKNLIRQLNNEGYRPIWARDPLARATPPQDEDLDALPPPPYNGNGSTYHQ